MPHLFLPAAGCDVLWGGCPIVTLPLERMASRVAASLCYATGLGPEMVVRSQQVRWQRSPPTRLRGAAGWPAGLLSCLCEVLKTCSQSVRQPDRRAGDMNCAAQCQLVSCSALSNRTARSSRPALPCLARKLHRHAHGLPACHLLRAVRHLTCPSCSPAHLDTPLACNCHSPAGI